jgi:RNA polymerase sigma-70 factor (ECF subfamily)
VSAASPNQAPDDASGTLGALLYADPRADAVPEQQWRELVHAVAVGDELALHALHERTHHVVFTLIMRIVQDSRTAEELVLDVFHDVWRRAASYDPGGGSVVGWILNQARSRAIDRIRYERRKKRVDPDPSSARDVDADLEDVFEVGVQRRILLRALARLPADERVAIETTFFEGLTHVEAAARLRQPLGTVKTRIRMGLQKLRALLASAEVEP